MITDLLSSCQDETRKLEVDGVVTKSVGPEMGWERCQGYPSLDVWFRNYISAIIADARLIFHHFLSCLIWIHNLDLKACGPPGPAPPAGGRALPKAHYCDPYIGKPVSVRIFG